jgi:predicted MFS family arabinose efflux permease
MGASFGYGIGGFISTQPEIAHFLGTFNYQRIFLIQSLGNTFYALTVWILLKETKVTKNSERASMIEGLKSLAKMDKSLLIFFIALMLMTIGSINLNKYIDVYFDELGYSPQDLGTFIMTTGFVSLFATLFLVSRFAQFRKQLLVIAIIQSISAIVVFYVFRAPSFLTAIYSVFMIFIIFRTIFAPLEQNYISGYAKMGGYGSIMGLRMSFISFGMVVGPLVGGFIYEYNSRLLFDMSAIFLLAGVCLLGLVHITKLKTHEEVN